MEIVQVNPGADPAITALRTECDRLLAWAESRVVTNNEEVELATEDLSGLANLLKAIETRRKEYTVPLDEHKKTIMAFFAQLTEPLERANKLTRDKILSYRRQVEAARAEAEAIERAKFDLARREEALKGEHTVDLAPVTKPEAAPSHVRTEVGTLGVPKVWKFEVENFSLLPDEFKLPNMVKIRKVVAAGVKIPGVKSWQEESLRITAK